VGKRTTMHWTTFFIKKTPQTKISPSVRKNAQSGHPDRGVDCCCIEAENTFVGM
jgi:hypothetical protein